MNIEKIIALAIVRYENSRLELSLSADEIASASTDYTPQAEAILSALKDAGFVTVPIRPTEAMLEAGSVARLTAWDEVTEPEKRFKGWPTETDYHESAETYKAMVAAHEGGTS